MTKYHILRNGTPHQRREALADLGFEGVTYHNPWICTLWARGYYGTTSVTLNCEGTPVSVYPNDNGRHGYTRQEAEEIGRRLVS